MRLSFALCVLSFIVALGCSGSSPTAPPQLSSQATGGNSAPGSHVLWGLWDVSIDPGTMTAQVVPLRGVEFTANVTRFMQPPISPINFIKIALQPGSVPLDGYFEVLVSLQHPFPGLGKYGGFDVRGILLADGSDAGAHDPSVLRNGPGDTHLLNPDGYTRWWNYPEFTSYGTIFGFTPCNLAPSKNHPTATVNPYKYFAEGLDETLPMTSIDFSKRGFFPVDPGIEKRLYKIQFKMDAGHPVYDFQFAVDASWALPDPSFAPDYPPEAFPLSANCQEAFAISVSDAGSTAFYVDSTVNGGEVKLNVEVFDWQSKGNPNGVKGEVSGIWAESPIFGAPVDVLASATVLPGSSDVSSVFQVSIGSLNLTQSGPAEVFLTVENTSPNTYKPQVPGGDTFAYPASPLAAYCVASATVSPTPPGMSPTVLSIDPNWGYQDDMLSGVTIGGQDFDPLATVDLEFAVGNDIAGTNVQWIDANTIKADFNLTSATIGLYDVKVTNPFYPPGFLPDGFEVKSKIVLKPIWPVTQGNPMHTGMIGVNGPSGVLGNPSWTVTWPEMNLGNATPIFLSETTAFCAVPFNYLDTNHIPMIAIDLADHSIKWTKVFNTTSHSSVVPLGISADGSVVLVWDWPSDDIYGLDAENGDQKWHITAKTFSSDSYASLDKSGNFIIPAEHGFMSVDPQSGSINWTTSFGDTYYSTPAVGTDGTIYGHVNGIANAELHAIDPLTGADKWSSFPTFGESENGVVFNPLTDGILVWGHGALYSYHDDGSSASLMWSQSYPYAWYCSPAVADNGGIYIIDGTGTLRRIDATTGSTLSSSSGWGGGYGTRPAIGKDGLIYANTEASFSVFNPDCSLKWSFYGFYDSYWCAPAIGLDGTVYSTRRNNGFCAWHD